MTPGFRFESLPLMFAVLSFIAVPIAWLTFAIYVHDRNRNS